MDSARIDGLPERAVAERVVPGIVAVAGDLDGTLYEGAFGRLSVDCDVPARPETMMRLASMTKAIASVAALQLLERGDLMLERFKMPLMADPGTRWEYGTSTDRLGQVIEAVSGQDLASYCDEHIFRPLGIANTTFRPSDEQHAQMMGMHARTPEGGLVQMPIEVPAELEALYAERAAPVDA